MLDAKIQYLFQDEIIIESSSESSDPEDLNKVNTVSAHSRFSLGNHKEETQNQQDCELKF